MVRDALEFGNLLDDLPDASRAEVLDTLLARKGMRVERIVSHGQATPEGEWYDQDEDEWVMVIAGAAELQIADEETPRRLMPGNFIYLPAHCRHRVAWTSPDGPTVWLAVHMEPVTQ